MGSILVCVDGSTRGWEAVEWAAAEAASRDCLLRIMHVFHSPSAFAAVPWDIAIDGWNDAGIETAEHVLVEAAARARRVAPTTPITVYAREGTAASAILREGRTDTLIVLGQCRNRGRLGRLRSVGRHVARRASCSVAIISLTESPAMGRLAGRVVVGLDGAENPLEVLGFAFRSAQRRRVGLTVIRSGAPPCTTLSGRDGAARQMTTSGLKQAAADEALQLCLQAFPDVEIQQRAYSGPSSLALLAGSNGAALLVIGAPRGRLNKAPLGRVRRAALWMARSPVAVVRPVQVAGPSAQ
jgi:nucleotide-binding universal stress UspA family protein